MNSVSWFTNYYPGPELCIVKLEGAMQFKPCSIRMQESLLEYSNHLWTARKMHTSEICAVYHMK